MIEVHHGATADDPTVIEIRSNLSMTLDRLAAVFLGLSALVLLAALGPTILGFWPIMVAAIIHLILVGWCLRLAWRGNWARERVVIGHDDVTIEHFDQHSLTLSHWPSAWVRVVLEDRKPGDARVVVTCQGRRQTIGTFLSHTEQVELVRTLRQGLAPHTAMRS